MTPLDFFSRSMESGKLKMANKLSLDHPVCPPANAVCSNQHMLQCVLFFLLIMSNVKASFAFPENCFLIWENFFCQEGCWVSSLNPLFCNFLLLHLVVLPCTELNMSQSLLLGLSTQNVSVLLLLVILALCLFQGQIFKEHSLVHSQFN